MSVLSWAIGLCRKTETWLVKRQAKDQLQRAEQGLSLTEGESDDRYDTLAPKTINDASMREYFVALKYALSQKNVRNIAITGSYGAGKSTVISSFMKYHCNDKYINVSLAGFDMTENETTVSPTHQEVELSILQQILYKENREKLPDSRIDRIIDRGPHYVRGTYRTLLKVIMPIAVAAFIIYFNTIAEFLRLPPSWTDVFNAHYLIKGIALVFLALIALFFITASASRIGIFDKKLKLSKIALLSGDVEASDQETPSLLNNCLDEIVYFFTKLEYKLVIFEDLDRLGTPEIFVKLREINKIVNNNIVDGNPVRFVYAVRDDLFLGADARTKFFDFILPVIPFMDSRNAFTLLKKKMSLDTHNDKYLKDISAYINDMRSLQNLVNEYHVFSNVVDNGNDKIKLLSLVFYKNIYALDYFFTDKKTGVLYSFIRDYRTRKLHINHFDSLEEELGVLQDEVENLNHEPMYDHRGIREDIVCRYIPKTLWDIIYFGTGNGHSNFHPLQTLSLIDDENVFLEFTSRNEDLYIGYFVNYRENSLSIFDRETRARLKEEYLKRKAKMGKDKNSAFSNLQIKINKLKESIKLKNTLSLSELTTVIGREKFADIAQGYLEAMENHDFVSEQQLHALCTDMRNGGLDALYLLLSDGLVMQDFMAYRSIFHEGSMTVNDNDYLKAVGQDLGYASSNGEYFIDDENRVISELVEHNRIYADGALHHQLVTHLIDNADEHLVGMIASLFSKSDEHILAVFSELYSRFGKPETFDKLIVTALQKNGYLDRMVAILAGHPGKKFTYNIAISVIACVSPEHALDKPQYRQLIHSLGCRIISQLTEENQEEFMRHVQQVDACYDELFEPMTPTEQYCLQFIAQNSLYQLTRHNVGIAISCLIENITPEEAERKPWTLAYEHKLNAVSDYFSQNIDTFVRDVFIYSAEDAGCIRYVLTHTSLSDSSKGDIVRKMTFSLADLFKISAKSEFTEDQQTISYHDLFYRYDRVAPGWSALIDYICEDCNMEILTAYVTKHAPVLGQSSPEVYDGDRYELLYMKIICNDDLEEQAYQSLVAPIEINMQEIDEQLSARNFCTLVAMQKLPLDADVYEKIAEQYTVQDENIRDAFVNWFRQYKSEFLTQPELYLRKEKDANFFDVMLKKVMNYALFTVQERADIVLLFIDYFIVSDITDLNFPNDVLLQVFNSTSNEEFKVMLFTRFIVTGLNKHQLAGLCHQLGEDELRNVFINRTQATIAVANRERVISILEHLQAVRIIRGFQVRESGKISVFIEPDLEDED
ncbi:MULTISPECIES: DNA-binding protein [Serratia]|uniref:YobI family P-loop NTPase n=1 Tax=Serratia TaxID=613 RepID=UPI001020D4DD|nr:MULTISPECIES: DNA-binding protein [Serratia]MBH3008323.1 DNA-binding protein [Serratia ureilytica]MBH3070085.1 DNA-binding protein [Serratia marcescens]RZF11446.1 DNA-binding protein [Serratia marcescens]